METGTKIIILILLMIGLLIIAPLLIMWLWNGMLPDMFGFPEIGFWRAVGLMILSWLLFGNKYSYKSNE